MAGNLTCILHSSSRWFTYNRFQGWIERPIRLIFLSVYTLSLWPGLCMLHHPHGRITGLLYRGVEAAGYTGQQRSSKGRALCCIGRHQFYAEHICYNLTPERAFCATAGDTYLLNGESLPLDN